jgi:hypothetical protein
MYRKEEFRGEGQRAKVSNLFGGAVHLTGISLTGVHLTGIYLL